MELILYSITAYIAILVYLHKRLNQKESIE